MLSIIKGPQKEIPNINIHELFELQVEKTPHRTAIIFKNQQITYAQLNSIANQLAYYLQEQGVRSESIVATFLPTSIELILSMLAIFKAGATCLALDTTHPLKRINNMIKETQASLFLSKISLLPDINVNLIDVTCLKSLLGQYPSENLKLTIDPLQLACILYTSGSSGNPKGVSITHQGLNNIINWHLFQYKINDKDKIALFASAAFDSLHVGIWPYLAKGASIEIVPPEIKFNSSVLKNWLIEKNITIVDLQTYIGASLLEQNWPPKSKIRIFKIGGEQINFYPERSYPFKIWNMYGPTEVTVGCIAICLNNIKLRISLKPPIGRPIDNIRAYILDDERNLLPYGLEGELYLSGIGLARGYFNRPDLTAKSFVINPFATNEDIKKGYSRLYKTGDLCRMLTDGTIEYLQLVASLLN